jgi:hypothetical protein
MTDLTTAEQAEKLSTRRARLFPVLVIFYVGQQASFFAAADAGRSADHFKIGAWVVMSVVLLAVLISGGSLARTPELRAMLNDETSRAHRSDALGLGFVMAMASAIITYVVATATPISTREAIHIIVSVGIAAAMIRFAMLERRAMRDA